VTGRVHWRGAVEHVADADAAPREVFGDPALHAREVRRERLGGERAEVAAVERLLSVDGARHVESPRVEVDARGHVVDFEVGHGQFAGAPQRQSVASSVQQSSGAWSTRARDVSTPSAGST